MIQLLLFTLIAGLIDCLNPTTIFTQAIILIKHKSPEQSIAFMAAIYVTYFMLGIGIYTGLANLINGFLKSLDYFQNTYILFTEFILLICLIITFFQKQKPTNTAIHNNRIKAGMLSGISLGIVTTVLDVPTAIPYLAFISKLPAYSNSIFRSLIAFVLYNFIYIAPLVVQHCFYFRYSKNIEQKLATLQRLVTKVTTALFYTIKVALCCFVLVDIILYVLQKDSLLYFLFN